MKNYLGLGLDRDRAWAYYVYYDTEGFQARRDLVENQVRIEFVDSLGRDGEPYRLNVLRVLRGHECRFLKAMTDFRTRMARLGWYGYEAYAGRRIGELEDLVGRDLETKGFVFAPDGEALVAG